MDPTLELFFEGMKYGIAIWGGVLAYAEIAKSIKLIKFKQEHPEVKSNIGYVWIKFGIGITGIYWLWYYIRSIFNIGIPAHQVWVRGPLMITIALFACGALMSLRRPQ